MEEELAEFKLEDGTAFLMDVDEQRATRGSGVQRVARREAERTLSNAPRIRSLQSLSVLRISARCLKIFSTCSRS